MKRRIAAILVADIVGYSGLMESDEDGTAHRLASRRSLIDAEIAKCDSRLFKAMGDAVLVEFASPINAVRCAVNIRTALTLAGQDEVHHLSDVESVAEEMGKRTAWDLGIHKALTSPTSR